MKVNLDDDLELSPSGFADFVRRLGNDSVGTFVTFMELEVDFLDVSLHIFVGVRTNINSPLMSVPVLFPLLAKCTWDISIDNWLNFSYSLRKDNLVIKNIAEKTNKKFSMSLPWLFRLNLARNQRALTMDSFFTSQAVRCASLKLVIDVILQLFVNKMRRNKT